MHTISSIGVWQTAFLGDAVLTLPLLATLRRAYPEARLDFYVRKGFESLFTGQKEIDSVHGFDKRGQAKSLVAAWKYGRQLSTQGYDLWISTHKSFRSSVVSRAVAAPMRIGYKEAAFGSLAYTHRVARRFDELDEIERLLELVRPLGIAHTESWPEYTPSMDAANKAQAFWAKHVTAPVIGIHPGSVWPTKRWPVRYFSKLAELAAEAGCQVMVFAGPGEVELAHEAMANAPTAQKAFIDVAGKLTLPELAAWIGRLDAYITGDSGPMHLAWTQNVPTIAMFGPTVRSLGFFPRGENTTVLEADLDCRPCGLHGHHACKLGHHNCMLEITPERAWEAVQKTMQHSGSRS